MYLSIIIWKNEFWKDTEKIYTNELTILSSVACRKQSNSLKNWESIKFSSSNKSNSGGIETHTLKDKTTPGSKTAPDFITTPSHTIECISLQPSSIITLSHI